MPRPIRLIHQIASIAKGDPVATAVRAEELGFDAVVLADHVGLGKSPVPILGAIAHATSSIRIGTYVLNNDMRNPVQLAWDVVALDHLSDGRIELALGAGHTPAEYAATGIKRSVGAVRKQRLAEATEIIRGLLDGERVTFAGEHYNVEDAFAGVAVQDHVPIQIGGNGDALLRHAAKHADGIGLQGLGRIKADGHQHEVKWSPDAVSAQIDFIRDAAEDRFDALELSALVQVVAITDDVETTIQGVCDFVGDLSPADAAEAPYLLIGSAEDIANKIVAIRDRWNISAFYVRSLDDFAPVIEAVKA